MASFASTPTSADATKEEEKASTGNPLRQYSSEPVPTPKTEFSKRNMTTDEHHPPTEFDHNQWCRVRDELHSLGGVITSDQRAALVRLAENMSAAQENYHQPAVVLLEGGRKFWENASSYLIGSERQGVFNQPNHESEKEYLERLTTMGYPKGCIDDIFTLKRIGACGVHVGRMSDPNYKRKVVHADYRLAIFVVEKAEAEMAARETAREAREEAREEATRERSPEEVIQEAADKVSFIFFTGGHSVFFSFSFGGGL